jgi:hypothetical protein
MSDDEEIRDRLLHGSFRMKGYAAMKMHGQNLCDESMICLLIDSLEQVLLKEEDYSKDELGFVTNGIVALSRCIQETSKLAAKASQQENAKLALVKLARSCNEQICGTALFWLGELRELGQFAIEAVLSQKIHEPVHAAYPSGITIRATAYRAIIKIDPEYAKSLGDIPARAELRRALNFWISESTTPVSREKLQKELMTLEAISFSQ